MSNITGILEYIPVEGIFPHPDNPRKDLGDLTELADSIRQNGIMQNLTVVPRESGGYTVIIGHRRLAAAKLAGLTVVPCAVADMDEKKQLRTMMMENMQRSDLNPYEEAQGFQLMLDLGDSIKEISQNTGFSETTIRSRTKLLELDQEKFRAAQERGATLSDYAELDKVSDPKVKNKLLDVIGTANFNNELQRAINAEKTEARRAYYIAELSKFAKEYTGDSVWQDFQRARFYYPTDRKEEVIRPDDADTKEYVFEVNSWGITLYVRKSAEDLAQKEEEETKRVERQRQEDEKKNRLAALKEVSNRARQLRRDFVENVGIRAIRANMKRVVSALVFCAFDISVELPVDQDSRDFFGIEGDEATQEAVAQAISAPERPLLKLAYSALECDTGEGYHDFWEGRYEENEYLDLLYDLLQALGYQMSDEEKALQNGTHELFAKPEE